MIEGFGQRCWPETAWCQGKASSKKSILFRAAEVLEVIAMTNRIVVETFLRYAAD